MRSRGPAILTVAFYLAVALWSLRVVLPDFTSKIATPADIPPTWRQITAADQKLVVAVVNANARAITHDPARILDGPQCQPLRRALMLGQHELNEGLLGVIPSVVFDDPAVTYNLVMLMSLLLPGLAMHALVRDWTGSGVAALVAGTLFATHPSRLGDVIHLSAIGNYWTVLTLLFLTRLFARADWTSAFALGLAAAAQTLDSIYPLIPHAILCGTVGIWLVWRYRRELPALAPKLAVAGVCIVAAAVLVLGPYLEFRAMWGSLAGRGQVFYTTKDLGPGGPAFSGLLAVVLAAIGLVDRLRHRSAQPRPHGALLVAGLLVLWMSVGEIRIPGLGAVPSLFTILAAAIPGFDAVRRGGVVISGWHLVVIVLAGYGVAALVRGRDAMLRTALAVLLLGLALGEIFVPSIARATFGRTVTLTTLDVRPSDPVLALYAQMPPGAVLDVPYELGPGRFFRMGDFVLAGAYHRRPVAACYNSFRVAIQDDIAAYATRVLGDARAAEALAALGFGNLVYHLGVPSHVPLPPPDAVSAHLGEIGRAGSEVLYRMPPVPPTSADPDTLAVAIVADEHAALGLVFRNRGALLFRHADPVEPTALVLRWYGPDDALLGENATALLFPSVLPAGEELRRALPAAVPRPPNAARVSIATAVAPDRVLGSLPLGR